MQKNPSLNHLEHFMIINERMQYQACIKCYFLIFFNRTDVCFHMLQNNQVMGQRHARVLLDSLDTNRDVIVLYDKYNMTGLDVSHAKHAH